MNLSNDSEGWLRRKGLLLSPFLGKRKASIALSFQELTTSSSVEVDVFFVGLLKFLSLRKC